ncbi:threonine/serine exporter family protein [Pseudoflavonifractor sp. AF19-9AC]|uniref:threonine/serine exporter family protein n=1 Tax=Pseudoflavonifractor sp. AF19-9AC TaxID=2292244 RepID=UPI001FA9F5BD|nr:threonine/serine exporter family protein [Pseudoflavonifractor sp. AF19-9AC]
MDYDKLLNLGVELGRRLMESGAEIYRVEESVERLLKAYGLDPQIFAIPNCLIVSVTTPQGHPITRMCRIPAHGTDIELLERCNELCRRLCRDPAPVEEAERMMEQLSNCRQFPSYVLLLGYMMTTGFFALFFGGGFWDCISAALCGMAVGGCILYGQWLTGSNIFFCTVVQAAVAAVLALVLVRIGVGQNLEAITIGTLMVLVPGRALTNAMREIMAGDIFSGLNRTAEVLLVATAMALGTAIPLVLGQYL